MSDFVVNDNVSKALQEALTPEAISAAIAAEAQNQGLVRDTRGAYVKDPATVAAEKVVADAAAKAAADVKTAATNGGGAVAYPFNRTEVINGKEFVFEAESELELERAINNAYRVAYALQQPAEQVTQVVDDPIDPAKQAADQAELELKFKNGEITATDYLEKTNAVSQYLENHGVPVEELKETIEQSRDTKFTQSWADATNEFLNSPAGADWPGGERNKTLIGMQLATLGLVDADDKVSALAQAYASMKSNRMVFTEEQQQTAQVADAAAKAVADAKAAADFVAARTQQVQQTIQQTAVAQPTQQRQASGVFGASSGTTANDMRDKAAAGPQIQVSANASPEEIMAHWKAQVLANGGNVDAAFSETFRGGKR